MRVVLPTLIRGWFASRAKRITFVTLVALIVAAALHTRIHRLELRRQAARAFSLAQAEVFYLPPVPVLEATALGHAGFVADLLFLRGVSYFITHLFTDRTFPWLDEYLERVVALDPHNAAVYEWAMKVVKYRQLITNDVIDESNRWAERGIEVFPDNWKFYLEIGFNHYFERDYQGDEDRAAWQRKAVDYFMIASSLPGSRLDPNFVTELYLRHNEREMALFYSLQRYQDGSDEEKEMLLQRVADLLSNQAARDLAEREERWKADMPYVPATLYDLIGGLGEEPIPLHLERDVAEARLAESMGRAAAPEGAPGPERSAP